MTNDNVNTRVNARALNGRQPRHTRARRSFKLELQFIIDYPNYTTTTVSQPSSTSPPSFRSA